MEQPAERAPATITQPQPVAAAQPGVDLGGRPEQFSPEEVAAALRLTKGTVSQAARRLRTTHRTIYRYIAKYPLCAEVIEEERDARVDAAELSLHKAVIAGEPWAVALTLKTLGRNRGYVERFEQTGAGGGPVQHQAVPTIREVVVHVPAALPPPAAPAAPAAARDAGGESDDGATLITEFAPRVVAAQQAATEDGGQ